MVHYSVEWNAVYGTQTVLFRYARVFVSDPFVKMRRWVKYFSTWWCVVAGGLRYAKMRPRTLSNFVTYWVRTYKKLNVLVLGGVCF